MEKKFLPDLKDIRNARSRIDGFIHRTPLLTSSAIDAIAGCRIYFKCENFQKIGAFKARGATNAVLKLSRDQGRYGVATHSSGNHAAALAMAASKSGMKAYIVMPSNAPNIKKQAVLGYGGEIIDCEPNQQSRESTLAKVVERTGAVFIPPFNHLDVIEGQATCALEMWEEAIDYDAIIAPVGGGGLIAGTALTTFYISPKTRVYAGEPKGADDAYRSFYANSLQPVSHPNTIADGLLTSLGALTFRVIRKHLADIFTVTEQEIVDAMRLVFERMKIVIEPSSAVPLAAVLGNPTVFANKKVGLILSGGNVDLATLPF